MVEVNLSAYDCYTILVVGCGGTGSQLLGPLMQLCSNMKKKGKIRSIVLIDGDRYEEKNLRNQKATMDDIGDNKAYVMATRYGYVFEDLDITSYEEYLNTPKELDDITRKFSNIIVIGCVDNNKARKIMHEYFTMNNKKQNLIYIDSGNGTSERTGQIVVGYKVRDHCILNSVGDVFNYVLEEEKVVDDELSCGVVIEESPQVLATNLYSAAHIMNVLTNILMFNKIENNVVFFDSEKCSVFSR